MQIFPGKLSTLMNLSERIVGRKETAQTMHALLLQLCRATLNFVHAYVFFFSYYNYFENIF